MKNIKLWIFIGCLSLTSLTSCFFEEKNIFDESSAQRMNDAMANDFDLLTSSPNGWALNYFPTDDQIGYTLLVNFGKDGSARIAAKNDITGNQYSEYVSLFRMIADNGPVLTFDSYNNILHYFSDAGDVPGPTGLGMEGDYEFIVMDTSSPDKILLKGKKRGVYMDLVRLPENQDWKDYFTKLDNMNSLLFNKNISQILLSVGDSIYTLDNGLSHIFVAVPYGGDPITENEKIPFIVTDNGIILSKTVTYNSSDMREFKLSDDKNELVCTDEGAIAKITSLYPADLFFSIINNYKAIALINSDANMSASVKNAYTAVDNGVTARSRKLTYIQFVNDRNWKNSLVIGTSRTGSPNVDGFLSFTMTKKNDLEIELAFNGFSGSFESNGKAYYDSYDGVSDFVAFIAGSYTLEVKGNALSSGLLRLTSKSDPNKWFDLQAK